MIPDAPSGPSIAEQLEVLESCREELLQSDGGDPHKLRCLAATVAVLRDVAQAELLDRSVASALQGTSTRLQNVFNYALDQVTLRKLCQLAPSRVLRARNMGLKSFGELIPALRRIDSPMVQKWADDAEVFLAGKLGHRASGQQEGFGEC